MTPEPTTEPTSATVPATPGAQDHAHHTPGYAGDRAKVLQRLRRIEGQVRGLERMVEQDTYCIDVLTQVSAVTRALQGVALLLLDDHVRHCVADDVRGGSDEKIGEAMDAIARLVRS